MLKMLGNTYQQKVFCCKQPNGNYCVGLTWSPEGNFKPYSSTDLPNTKDHGKDSKTFTAKEWRKAERYAKELSEKYELEYYISR